MPTIRPATPADLPAINAIYNYYVLHSTATYQVEPATLPERQAWLTAHGPWHPALVIEGDLPRSPIAPPRHQESAAAHEIDTALAATGILGWSSLSPFHARAAYRRTVENSVYIHPHHLRQGLGHLLLTDLLTRAPALGHHTIIAIISADQPASIALHERHGFTRAGTLRQVGYKFDRYLDVAYLQRMLSS